MLESGNLGESNSLYSSAKGLTSELKIMLVFFFFLFCAPLLGMSEK